ERRVEDRRAALGGTAVAVELELLAAQVHAERQLQVAARQGRDAAGEGRVEGGHDGTAAVEHHAAGRGRLERGDRLRTLLLARHQERVEQAAAKDLLQALDVVVAGTEPGFGLAAGTGQAQAVIPVADL